MLGEGIIKGMGETARNFLGSYVSDRRLTTVQYPEEQHVPSPNYRGVHRLNKDEQGRVKCVACMLCATACPAHCIDIVGATAPSTWPDREPRWETERIGPQGPARRSAHRRARR